MNNYDEEIQRILSGQGDDQSQHDETMLAAGLGRAGETIGAAIAGTKADTRFYDQLQASAANKQQADKDRKMKLLSYLQRRDDNQTNRAIAQRQHDENLGVRNTAIAEDTRQFNEKMELEKTRAKNSHSQFMAKIQAAKNKAVGKKKQTPTQLKKSGLAKIGFEAESQYQAARAKGAKDGSWDPTSYMDWMDSSSWMPNAVKSDAAIEAIAAASSWGDSYLRDESGAAIPESERGPYYQMYFPQKGDTEKAVANKQRLRHEKMNNALIAAGEEPTEFVPITHQKGGSGTAVASGNKAGKIIRTKSGKRYQVQADGKTLKEIK